MRGRKASATNISVTVEIINDQVQNKTKKSLPLDTTLLVCVKSRHIALLKHQICQNNMKCPLRPSIRDFKK